ncbi:hypothetical protein MCG45_06785 [Clostridium perfringens]|uniref:hypothetical protein n=1 Tax=Clostridium perfringens TaxID=1502 RepID=UPI001F05631E|nr:hypothetical protein [Clostridium perfringens]MCH1962581.1 hypothetical protein [Clostridium perfringens]
MEKTTLENERKNKMKKELINILNNKGINDTNIYINQIKSAKEVNIVRYKDMYNKEGNNSYKVLSSAIGNIGVYIFYKEISNKNFEFIYAGECHTLHKKRDLSTRIEQHLTAGNKGGFPYKLDEKGLYSADDIIESFDTDDIKIAYIILKDSNVRDVIFLESFFISILRPKYNFVLKEVEEDNNKN